MTGKVIDLNANRKKRTPFREKQVADFLMALERQGTAKKDCGEPLRVIVSWDHWKIYFYGPIKDMQLNLDEVFRGR